MRTSHFPARPSGAIPSAVPSDDDIILAQARARKARSDAFLQAVRWGACTIRRFAA